MREKPEVTDNQDGVDESGKKGTSLSAEHLQQLDDFFDSGPHEFEDQYWYIFDSSELRTERELDDLKSELAKANGAKDKQVAQWKLSLAELDDAELQRARMEPEQPALYRRLAFEEFIFRKQLLLNAELRSIKQSVLLAARPDLTLKRANLSGNEGRRPGMPVRFAYEYLKRRPDGTFKDFLNWYCCQAVNKSCSLGKCYWRRGSASDDIYCLSELHVQFDDDPECKDAQDPSCYEFYVNDLNTGNEVAEAKLTKSALQAAFYRVRDKKVKLL